MRVTVRRARPAEYPEVGQLTVAGFAAGPYGPATAPGRLAFELDAAGRARDGELLVAVDDATGALVGTLSLLLGGTDYARVATDGESEVRLLATAPAARGHGVGEALMLDALERSRASAADALVLDTGPANYPAQRLYHRLGFERAPRRETTQLPRVGTLLVFRYDLRATTGVLIRLVRPAEIAAVGELSRTAYAHDYDDLPADYLASIADVGPRAREHEVWVAQDRASGALLGTVTTPRPGANLSALGRPDELDLRLLAVDAGARGRGIGALLTRHAVALAGLRGLRRVVLNSGPDMLGAHRLYERLGFARMPARASVLPDGRPLHAYGLELRADPVVTLFP